MKHTHKGHCQACGRIQANRTSVPTDDGTIAQHGYRVAGFGFFNGVCPGSDRAPLEKSREFCDDICNSLILDAERHAELMAKYESGERIPETVLTTNRLRTLKGWEYERIPWAEAADRPWLQNEEVQRQASFHRSQSRMARAHAEQMRKLADEVHGQELRPAVHPDVQPITKGLEFIRGDRKLTVSGRKRQRWHVCTDQDGKSWHLSAQEIRKYLKQQG